MDDYCYRVRVVRSTGRTSTSDNLPLDVALAWFLRLSDDQAVERVDLIMDATGEWADSPTAFAASLKENTHAPD